MSMNIVQKGVIGFVLAVFILLATVCVREIGYRHKIADFEQALSYQKTLSDTRLDVIRMLNDRLKEFPKRTTVKTTTYGPGILSSGPAVISYVETITEEPVITHTTVYVNVPVPRKRISLFIGYTFNNEIAAGLGYYLGREITVGFKTEGRYAGLFLLWGFK